MVPWRKKSRPLTALDANSHTMVCSLLHRLSGYALVAALMVIALATEAHARVETISWRYDDALAVEGFVLYVGRHSGAHEGAIDLGLPAPDGEGLYWAQVTVEDDAIVYLAVAAYDYRYRLSPASAEEVRAPNPLPVESVAFGLSRDLPVIGDWDGDGATDVGVVRIEYPDLRFIFDDGSGSADASPSVTFGDAELDYPVVGDWLGGGTAAPGTVRIDGDEFLWRLDNAAGPGGGPEEVHFGDATDHPLVSHEGRAVVAGPTVVALQDGRLVYRILEEHGDPDDDDEVSDPFAFDLASGSGLEDGLLPLLGDWRGEGMDMPGYALDDGGRLRFVQDAGPDIGAWSVWFGDAVSDEAISGDWDGDGFTDVGAVRRVGGRMVFLLSLWPFRCSNGTLEPGEWCDDGNAIDGDGCSSSCRLEVLDENLDSDLDTVPDFLDNCPTVPNTDQTNTDADLAGDACDFQSCANGLVEPGETCDDGNVSDGDGCSANCAIEECGDGILQLHMGEQCDEWAPVTPICDYGDMNCSTCSSSCAILALTTRYCGDGLLEAEVEACDDGNFDDTDDCLSSCEAATCGDGYLRAGIEACDDANFDDTDDCLSSCEAATCGDGYLQAGIEACDDANLDDTDDCLSSCEVATCGDGYLQAGIEACDDGNSLDSDGCSSECAIEAMDVVIEELIVPAEATCDAALGVSAAVKNNMIVPVDSLEVRFTLSAEEAPGASSQHLVAECAIESMAPDQLLSCADELVLIPEELRPTSPDEEVILNWDVCVSVLGEGEPLFCEERSTSVRLPEPSRELSVLLALGMIAMLRRRGEVRPATR